MKQDVFVCNVLCMLIFFPQTKKRGESELFNLSERLTIFENKFQLGN